MSIFGSTPQNDELAVLRGFHKSEAQIDPAFKASLRGRFIDKAAKPAASLGWSMGLWPILAGGALGVLMSVFVLLGLNSTPPTTINVPNKQHIISNLLSKNSTVLLNSAINADTVDLTTLPADSLIPEETIVPSSPSASTKSASAMTAQSKETIKANYTFVRTNWTAGAVECGTPFPYDRDSAITELYAYKSVSGEYLKSVSYTANNELTNFQLITPEKTIHYRGGKYAAGTTIPEHTDDTSSQTSAESSDISQLVSSLSGLPQIAGVDTNTSGQELNPDIEVEGTQTMDGKTYVVVKWVDQTECAAVGLHVNSSESTVTASSSTESSPLVQIESNSSQSAVVSNHDIYNRLWLDAETYVIAKQEKYLDVISTDTLLGSVIYEVQGAVISDTDAQSVFKYDYDASIKDVTPIVTDTESERLSTYINSQELKIFHPSDNGWALQRIDIPTERASNPLLAYQHDRDFYPDGELGDRLWDPFRKLLSEQLPLLTWNYRSGDNNSKFVLYVSRIPFKDYSAYNPEWSIYKDVIATKETIVIGTSLIETDRQYVPIPPKNSGVTNPADFIAYCTQEGINNCEHHSLFIFEYSGRFYVIEIVYVGTTDQVKNLLKFELLSSVDISRLK